MSKPIAIRIPEAQHLALKEHCDRLGINMADIILPAIAETLATLSKGKEVSDFLATFPLEPNQKIRGSYQSYLSYCGSHGILPLSSNRFMLELLSQVRASGKSIANKKDMKSRYLYLEPTSAY
jgi:hypothetical protein